MNPKFKWMPIKEKVKWLIVWKGMDGRTDEECRKLFGYSNCRAVRKIKEHPDFKLHIERLKHKLKYPIERNNYELTDGEKELIRKLISEGKSRSYIADQLNRDRHTVGNYVQTFYAKPHFLTEDEINEIIRLHNEENWTNRKIAKHIGRGYSTVARVLIKHIGYRRNWVARHSALMPPKEYES